MPSLLPKQPAWRRSDQLSRCCFAARSLACAIPVTAVSLRGSNYNDDFAGGEVMSGNLLLNYVKE